MELFKDIKIVEFKPEIDLNAPKEEKNLICTQDGICSACKHNGNCVIQKKEQGTYRPKAWSLSAIDCYECKDCSICPLNSYCIRPEYQKDGVPQMKHSVRMLLEDFGVPKSYEVYEEIDDAS
jgi:hypothetical protein